MSPIINARLPYADPAGKPAPKVSIDLQIRHCRDELERLRSEASGTPRLKRTRSESELLATRQEKVVESLEWLREHRAAFLEWLATRQAGGAQ